MKTRFNVKASVNNNLFWYLAIVILVPLASMLVIESKNSPKDYQKFNIFANAKLKENSTFNEELKELLKEDYIVKTHAYTEDEEMFNSYNNTYGTISDILIYPESYLEKIDYFPYLDFAQTNKLYSSSNYVRFEKHYGYKVNDSKLSTYFDFKNESYYLLISNKSVHTLDIFDEGKTNQIDRFLTNFVI